MLTAAVAGFSTLFGLSSDEWRTSAAVLQAVAAVIALVYIAIQLSRQSKSFAGQDRAAQAIVYGGFTDIMVSIDRCFFEHPELRPYFYSGDAADRDDPIYEKLTALAEMLRDLEDHLDRQQDMLQDSYEGWKAYFEHLRERSPTYVDYCANTHEWYKNTVTTNPVPPSPRPDGDMASEDDAPPQRETEDDPPAGAR